MLPPPPYAAAKVTRQIGLGADVADTAEKFLEYVLIQRRPLISPEHRHPLELAIGNVQKALDHAINNCRFDRPDILVGSDTDLT